jgi:hypothetical protein
MVKGPDRHTQGCDPAHAMLKTVLAPPRFTDRAGTPG